MRPYFTAAVLWVCLSAVWASPWASAQQATQAQLASSATAKSKVYVAFRSRDWTTKHLHDAEQAKTHEATLKQLGCEVKTASHNGHIDVSCRTVYWKSLALDTHEQAHHWVTWLQQSGFETIHGHRIGTSVAGANATAQREVVQFRLSDWQTQHVHESLELGQLMALYRGLGCDVQSHSHNGHSDVRVRCPEWMEIELPSHEAAHSWQKFLGEQGFETKHEH